MKRFFAFLTTILFAAATIAPASALTKGEWDIKGGLGWFSVPDVMGALIAGLGTAFGNPKGSQREGFVPLLNPNIELHYGINNWFALGGSLSVGYSSAKSVEADGCVNKSVTALYPSLMVSAKTTYLRSGAFSMYGSWGIGIMALMAEQWSVDGSDNNNNFAIAPMGNLYPLGLSYGGRTGGFLEAGWGAKGFVNVGIYHTF